MITFLFIGLLVIIFTSFYLLYHFILKFKQPERKVPKKVILSLIIGGILSFSIGAAFLDTSDQVRLDEEIEANEVLSAEVSDLNTTIMELQASNEDFNKEIIDLSELNSEISNENKTLTEEVKTLTKNNEDLEKDINTLTVTVKELEGKVSEREVSTKTESKKSVSTKSKATDTSDSVEQSSKKTSIASNSSSTNNTSSNEDCDIKGSKSGIYHVPGSTYYNRTKNVVQWFCSTSEAVNAGYRAPEK